MEEAFVIMQIGNPQLDKLWREAYAPAIKTCGLDPKRVDKHNEGRLLQSEIANFIKTAKIIIADLTNERPNCYLEVGYAMGIDKFQNLILCAREDHHFESPNYAKGGPKVHFDLSGYGFLWWDESKIERFRDELITRIRQRLEVLKKSTATHHSVAKIWQEEERELASIELKTLKLTGFYEISFTLAKLAPDRTPKELLQIAESAEIHLSGWPIGVVLHNEDKPKPEADGIKTIISSEDRLDYWCLKKDSRFYFLRSFEEDTNWKENKPGKNIHFDTRIRRISEAIMYCSKLYQGFSISEDNEVLINFLYGGLKNRLISTADPHRLIMDHWRCSVNEVKSSVTQKLSNLMPNIKDTVFKLSAELFTMFDYFELDKGVSDDIVDKFMSGR